MSRVIEEKSLKPPPDLKSQQRSLILSTTNQIPTSNHTPPAPEEGHPKLSHVWQSMIFLMSFLSPLAYFVYAYTGDTWYGILGVSLIPFSGSSGVLVFFASPSNASIEYYLVVYVGIWVVLTCGGGAYGMLLSDPDGSYALGVHYLFYIPLSFLILYFITMLRRRIGDFSRPSLKEYISRNIFLQGIGSIPPMIFFTTETAKCLLKGDHYELTGMKLLNVCGGILQPQFSICLMFFLFLVAKVAFLPLTTTKVEMYELASFRNISLKLKVQMVFMGVLIFANTVNFGILGEGPMTILTWGLMGLVSLSALVIGFTEVISIIFTRRHSGVIRESQVDRGDVDVVMEDLGENVSSGLDAV